MLQDVETQEARAEGFLRQSVALKKPDLPW